MYTCIDVYMYICIDVYMYVCIYIYIYVDRYRMSRLNNSRPRGHVVEQGPVLTVRAFLCTGCSMARMYLCHSTSS